MTTSKILNRNFDFKAVHVGLMLDKNLWQHDKWTILIDRQTFDYSTGTGHREVKTKGKKDYRGYRNEALYYLNGSFKKERQNLELINSRLEKFTRPKAPNIDDVLYSLLMDSEAEQYTFDEWCNTFGCDVDSKSAERMYNGCRDNATKVRRFIDNIEEAREMFQDY